MLLREVLSRFVVARGWWHMSGANPKKITKRDFYENEAFFFKNRNNAVKPEPINAKIGTHIAPIDVSTTRVPNSSVAVSTSPSLAVSTISLPSDIVCKSDNAGANFIAIINKAGLDVISNVICNLFVCNLHVTNL